MNVKKRTQTNLMHPFLMLFVALCAGLLLGFWASIMMSFAMLSPQKSIWHADDPALTVTTTSKTNLTMMSIRSAKRSITITDAPALNTGMATTKTKHGWKDISVYVGDGHQTLPEGPQWHAQTKQDEIVAKVHPKPGFFIDLAANDAVALSNTLALERDFGWEGLCIEPNAQYWEGLYHRKCKLIAAIVADKENEQVHVNFEMGAYGGIVRDDVDNKPDKVNHPYRRTAMFADILRRYGVPGIIDYLNMDVEGAEDLVMSSFPFDQYKVNIMTIERPSKNMKLILRAHGYLYKHDAHAELFFHKDFDAIQTVYPKGRYDFKDPNRVE